MKIVFAVLAAMVIFNANAQRVSRRMYDRPSPTNSFKLCGVTMPPRYTQELYEKREKITEEFRERLAALDAEADSQWRETLTEAQNEALREASRLQEQAFAEAQAKSQRAYEELCLFTNRANYVASDFTDRRRREVTYKEGLTFKGEKVIKSVFYSTERGKVKVEMLYTIDDKGREKKQRIDFDEIVKRMKGGK